MALLLVLRSDESTSMEFRMGVARARELVAAVTPKIEACLKDTKAGAGAGASAGGRRTDRRMSWTRLFSKGPK